MPTCQCQPGQATFLQFSFVVPKKWGMDQYLSRWCAIFIHRRMLNITGFCSSMTADYLPGNNSRRRKPEGVGSIA